MVRMMKGKIIFSSFAVLVVLFTARIGMSDKPSISHVERLKHVGTGDLNSLDMHAATQVLTSNAFLDTDQRIDFYAPKIILEDGFHARAGSCFKAGIKTIDISFVNFVDPNDASALFASMTNELFEEITRENIRILNYWFKHKAYGSEPERQFVRFRFRKAVNWVPDFALSDFKQILSCNPDTDPNCWGEGDPKATLNSELNDTAVDAGDIALKDVIRIDDDSIFVFIDCGKTFASRNIDDTIPIPSFVSINSIFHVEPNWKSSDDPNNPIDAIFNASYNGIRDDHNRTIAHEIGHTLGLAHVRDCNVNAKTDNSNIMNSLKLSCDPCDSNSTGTSSGYRNLFFEFEPYVDTTHRCQYWHDDFIIYDGAKEDYGQVEIIMEFVMYYLKRWE